MANMFKQLRAVVAVALISVAAYAAAVDMRSGHPDTYVVKKGDTLWDIAGRFLQKPWLWPEIWQANPQVKNPHLIYPGDVLSLAYLNRVATMEVDAGPRMAPPVNAVPLGEVEPFLRDLTVVDVRYRRPQRITPTRNGIPQEPSRHELQEASRR